MGTVATPRLVAACKLVTWVSACQLNNSQRQGRVKNAQLLRARGRCWAYSDPDDVRWKL